jgi:catechol 2,3-dioxygenase-like lactoylglutathione lyase family enzyme
VLSDEKGDRVTIAQIRIARRTDRLDEVVRFYRDGLGFEVIGKFADHDGYDGYMLALPGRRDHLEFTSHREGSPCPAPTRDNLLVLYLPEIADITALTERLSALGYRPVETENPYWATRNALTFADPDGWRVVLFPGAGL